MFGGRQLIGRIEGPEGDGEQLGAAETFDEEVRAARRAKSPEKVRGR